jgi:hypothetical protein
MGFFLNLALGELAVDEIVIILHLSFCEDKSSLIIQLSNTKCHVVSIRMEHLLLLCTISHRLVGSGIFYGVARGNIFIAYDKCHTYSQL